MGVVDLPLHAMVCRAACLATMPLTSRTAPQLRHYVAREHEVLMTSLAPHLSRRPTDMLGTVSRAMAQPTILKHVQRRLSVQIHARTVEQLVVDPLLPLVTKNSWLAYCSEDDPAQTHPSTGQSWLFFGSLLDPRCRLSNDELRYTLQRRVGAQPAVASPCQVWKPSRRAQCGKMLDPLGAHADSCDTMTVRRRHNAIRDFLHSYARDAHIAGVIEQHSGGTLALDEGRWPRQRLTVHADLQLLPIHADPLWIDVRVT
eukprot:3984209-Amphidinium_carterae.1